MKILVTGATGQLGLALVVNQPEERGGQKLELILCSRSGKSGMDALDLSSPKTCGQDIFDHQPEWLINAGAYTAVDRAEVAPDVASLVNAEAPRVLAKAVTATGGHCMQISNDFVFDGSHGHPYATAQTRRPLGVYGASKAGGEEAVEEMLGAVSSEIILRANWLNGPVGNNLCSTILRLHRGHAASGRTIMVVADQVGCPTSTQSLAQAFWGEIGYSAEQRPISQVALPTIPHYSDTEAATWNDIAVAIGELGQSTGLIRQQDPIRSITTDEYPTTELRPSFSLLDCSDSWKRISMRLRPWRNALEGELADFASYTRP